MKHLKEYPHITPFNEENKHLFKFEKEELCGEEVDVLFRKGHPGLTREQCDEIRAKGGQVRNFSICGSARPAPERPVVGRQYSIRSRVSFSSAS